MVSDVDMEMAGDALAGDALAGDACGVLEFVPDECFVEFLAADEPCGGVDPLQLAVGILVELERSGGFEEAEMEALAHIGEDACYYGERGDVPVSSPEADVGGVVDGFSGEGDRKADGEAGLIVPGSEMAVPSILERFCPSEVTASVCPYWRDKLCFYLLRSSRHLGGNKFSFSYGDMFGDYEVVPVVGGYEVKADDNIGAFPSRFQSGRHIGSCFNLGGDKPVPYVAGRAAYYFIDNRFVPLNGEAVEGYAFLLSCYDGGSPDAFMDSYRKAVYSRGAMLSSAISPLDVSQAACRRARRVPLFSDAEVEAFGASEGVDVASFGEWVDKGRDDVQRLSDARAYFDAQGSFPTFNDFEGYLKFAGDYEDELGARALYDKLVKAYEDEGTFLVDSTGKPVDSSREAWGLFSGLVRGSRAFRDMGFGTADSIVLYQACRALPRGAGFQEFLEMSRSFGVELSLDKQSEILSRFFGGRLGSSGLSRRSVSVDRSVSGRRRAIRSGQSFDSWVSGCMAQLRNIDPDAAKWFRASEARMRTFRDIVLEEASIFKAAKAASDYYAESMGVASRYSRSVRGRRIVKSSPSPSRYNLFEQVKGQVKYQAPYAGFDVEDTGDGGDLILYPKDGGFHITVMPFDGWDGVFFDDGDGSGSSGQGAKDFRECMAIWELYIELYGDQNYLSSSARRRQLRRPIRSSQSMTFGEFDGYMEKRHYGWYMDFEDLF